MKAMYKVTRRKIGSKPSQMDVVYRVCEAYAVPTPGLLDDEGWEIFGVEIFDSHDPENSPLPQLKFGVIRIEDASLRDIEFDEGQMTITLVIRGHNMAAELETLHGGDVDIDIGFQVD
jgi:hypothetical protein